MILYIVLCIYPYKFEYAHVASGNQCVYITVQHVLAALVSCPLVLNTADPYVTE